MQHVLASKAVFRTTLHNRVSPLASHHIRPFSVTSVSYIHLWDHLPGENMKEPWDGLALLRGRVREERFRLKPQINKGQQDRFDVVVGK
jgi:hypothetical protein